MVDGPEAIREARARWRRGQIVRAATRLMEDNGFHQMTVSALAQEAGVSVGTIYQYVTGKEDVLLLVFIDILEAYRVEIPRATAGLDDPVERLQAAFGTYCRIVDERRDATVLAYRESKTLNPEALAQVKALELETTGYFRECLVSGVAHGRFVVGDVELVAYDLVMLAHMWALKHWFFRDRMTIDDYVTAQLAIVLAAITEPAGGSATSAG